MRFPPLKIYLPALAMALAVPVQAAEWTAEPDLSLRSGYNDNYLLSTGPHSSVWETDLIASTKFGVAKENQGLFGDAGITARRFSGGSGQESSDLLDREDYFFTTDAYHQTERNVFRGNLDYIRDSTQDSEVDETGSFTNVYATRIRKTAGTSWARTLTERMSLDLGYQYNDTSFADDREKSQPHPLQVQRVNGVPELPVDAANRGHIARLRKLPTSRILTLILTPGISRRASTVLSVKP